MKPNIVFYFSDQQRWDTLGCYGQKLDVTPNLDMLAKEGVLFSNAFTCQPVCGPARACLQTGKYATETGCYRNAVPLPLGIPTLADYFNAAGYDTAYVGKWHLASGDREGDPKNETGPVPVERRGGYKDYWMASDVLEFTSHGYNGYMHDIEGKKTYFTGYRPDCVNNYAIDYIHGRKSENPFFLFISQIEPHHQNDHNRFEGPDGSKERFADFEIPGDLEGTAGNWRENYPDYLGQCRSLDYNVGRLIDTLKTAGVWDNTILFYTSDHGSHFCTRNSEYKRSCHDGCTHIPMVAAGGCFKGGKIIDDMVSLIDIPVTLLDCAGIERPGDFKGDSLKKLAETGNEGRKKHVFMQISESQVGRAVRTRDFKYSVRAIADGWKDSGADIYYEDFLYDLRNDPYEKINLVSDPAYESERRKLKTLLVSSMEEAGEAAPQILPVK